jgi:hypothetical protein
MAWGTDYVGDADREDAFVGTAMQRGLRPLLGFGETEGGAVTGMIYRPGLGAAWIISRFPQLAELVSLSVVPHEPE